jgi:molecular chaperone DnaK
MKLGVDFGTTRVVVAAVDRGNYPLLSFETPDGTADWFPALAAIRSTGSGFEYRFGWDAWRARPEPGWILLRSLKRYLHDAGPETTLPFDGSILLTDLLTGMTEALREAILQRIRSRAFGSRVSEDEPLEVMLGVPANANSNQRFLTIDAFRKAGFIVLGMVNEPSAASIEFIHSHKGKGKILVYDLGGGTFDASVVEASEGHHAVIACEGISQLGGDDFDFNLAELALGKGELYGLQMDQLFRLLEECRLQKEALHPNSRKIALDLDHVREGMGQVTVPVADFYGTCQPIVDQTIALTERLAAGQEISALYVTGGASELPLIARSLKEHFGRKVLRSEYMRSATAIGLAIHAADVSKHAVREMFHRHFGVWRESDSGHQVTFDCIFPRGTGLPGSGEPPLKAERTYRPVHNIGHLRYLEATALSPDGQPTGDITVWDEILFPFDPALRDLVVNSTSVERVRQAPDQDIEEVYECDSAGVVRVTIHNRTAGYSRDYPLAHWNRQTKAARNLPDRKRVVVLGRRA